MAFHIQALGLLFGGPRLYIFGLKWCCPTWINCGWPAKHSFADAGWRYVALFPYVPAISWGLTSEMGDKKNSWNINGTIVFSYRELDVRE